MSDVMRHHNMPDSEEQHALINAIVDEGWNGNWTYERGKMITIYDYEGNLHDYLKKYTRLEYLQVVNLALHLAIQIAELAKFNKTLLCINMQDIIISGNGFIISNLSNTVPLDCNNKILLTESQILDHCLPELSAPELNNNNKDNFDQSIREIHISAVYYSIALVCLKCLHINEEMNEIHGSKLYYLLQRCLRSDPMEREFLYI